MREVDLTNRSIENEGIIQPVVSLDVRYYKPAHYNDLLTLTTTIREMPSVKIIFIHIGCNVFSFDSSCY